MTFTIAVSLRSKGLSSFATSEKRSRIRAKLLELANECCDLIIAAVLVYFNLSWTAWISLIITILATVSA